MPDRAILAVKYTPAGAAGAVGRAVSGFLRYVQYRDRHGDLEALPDADTRVSGLLKYVAYRDRTGPRGRLFDAAGPAGDCERRTLADFVARAVRSTRPQPVAAADGTIRDARRAVYRMVISPEHAAGLDLRELTRAVMQQLSADVGTRSLKWVAAEHRNTAHPHVHVVLAGFVELGEGRYRGVVLTRERLKRMKEALAQDLCRQRGEPVVPPTRQEGPARGAQEWPARDIQDGRPDQRRRMARRDVVRTPVSRGPRGGHAPGLLSVEAALRRAAQRYRRELEYEQRQDERERGRVR